MSQISLHNHVLWYVDTQSVLVLSSLLFKINGVCLFFRLPGAKNETEAGRNVGETTAVMFLQLFITETCCVCWINEFTLKIWASRVKPCREGHAALVFSLPDPWLLHLKYPLREMLKSHQTHCSVIQKNPWICFVRHITYIKYFLWKLLQAARSR